MTGTTDALRYAVRLDVLAKYLGQLLLIIALLTMVPAAVGLLYGDYPVAAAYLAVMVVLAAAGWAANRLPGVRHLQTNEAIVISAVAFLAAALAPILPFMVSGLSLQDAFFETVSGVTTTGLTMLDDVRSAAPILLFGRAWLQWTGGLGIVVFSLVLILPAGAVAKDMGETEAVEDDLLGGVKAFFRQVIRVYVVMSLIGVVILALTGVSPVNAVMYALAAVSTGGFAPHAASAADLAGWPAQTALVGLSLAGALPMLFYIRLIHRKRVGARVWSQIAGILLLALILGGIMVLDDAINHGQRPSSPFFQLPWMAFSAQTTAGFSVLKVAGLPPASKISLIMAMTIGGGMGSTAGGIKLMRLLAFFHLIRWVVHRTHLSSHAVYPLHFLGRAQKEGEGQKLLLIPLLFVAVVGISWLPFTLYGYPALDSLFDVVSATGTVGLSSGVSGHQLPGLLKLVLCADMLMGRLEILAWLVVLSPKTWIGRRL